MKLPVVIDLCLFKGPIRENDAFQGVFNKNGIKKDVFYKRSAGLNDQSVRVNNWGDLIEVENDFVIFFK